MSKVENKQEKKEEAPQTEITVQVSKRLKVRTDVRAGGLIATVK
jgi:hypothetical protein